MTLLGGAQSRLTAMLLLTTIFFMVEIIVGYITNSMALIADSFHMFSDAIALVIAFISVRMSPKKWSKNTFGWARAEILGALVNAVFLCALCFSILIESIKRFLKRDVTHEPHLILIVGGLGLFINLIGLLLFSGHHHHHHHHHHHSHNHNAEDHLSHHHNHHIPMSEHPSYQGDSNENNSELEKINHGLLCKDKSSKADRKNTPTSSQMNMRGVFLHVMADALGSVIVMISAIVVILTDKANPLRFYIDPTLSVLMVILILISTWPLLTESAMILLQTVPTHIQVDSLRKRLTQEIQGVLAVHEFHIWKLAGDRIIASAHIRCHNLQDYMRIAEKVKEFFHNEGIHSTTIQPEFIDFENEIHDESYDNCVLDCPSTQRTHCAPQTCCGVQNSQDNINTMTSATSHTMYGGNDETMANTILIKRGSAKPEHLESILEDSSMKQKTLTSNTTDNSHDDNFQVISSSSAAV